MGKKQEQVRGYIDRIIALNKEASRCDCDCLQYSYKCGTKIQKSVSLPIVGMEPAVKKQ